MYPKRQSTRILRGSPPALLDGMSFLPNLAECAEIGATAGARHLTDWGGMESVENKTLVVEYPALAVLAEGYHPRWSRLSPSSSVSWASTARPTGSGFPVLGSGLHSDQTDG